MMDRGIPVFSYLCPSIVSQEQIAKDIFWDGPLKTDNSLVLSLASFYMRYPTVWKTGICKIFLFIKKKSVYTNGISSIFLCFSFFPAFWTTCFFVFVLVFWEGWRHWLLVGWLVGWCFGFAEVSWIQVFLQPTLSLNYWAGCLWNLFPVVSLSTENLEETRWGDMSRGSNL